MINLRGALNVCAPKSQINKIKIIYLVLFPYYSLLLQKWSIDSYNLTILSKTGGQLDFCRL